MADEKVYALDEGENKRESMTKEQVLAAIANAISTGQVTGDYTAFIEMIKEQNKGAGVKIWLGTQAELLALAETDENTIYYVTDMSTLVDLDAALTTLKQQLSNGEFKVGAAEAAGTATEVEKIRGYDIEDVFRVQSGTAYAENAIKSISAETLTYSIKTVPLTQIFEDDNKTVKKATEATTINKYQHNIQISASDSGGSSANANVLFSFISDISTPITYDDIQSGVDQSDSGIPFDVLMQATGYHMNSGKVLFAYALEIDTEEGCIVVYTAGDGQMLGINTLKIYENNVINWTDTVSQL